MEARKTKPFPWICPDCRTKTVSPVQRDYRTSTEHEGAGYEITIHGVQVPTCSQCGQAIITSELSERVSAELRNAVGLLPADEIRAKRETLGLTPAQLAAALRIAEATLIRWETGMQLQSRALDLLLRLFFDSQNVRQACIPAASARSGDAVSPAPT